MKKSAGLVVFRTTKGLEVLLVHPGGPFWKNKDVWGIPKGLYDESEDPYSAARREFSEEIGQPALEAEPIDLGEIKASNKIIHAYGVEGSLDVSQIKSNLISIEWPPRSGREIEVPEVDKAAWLLASEAVGKMHAGQDEFVKRLAEKLGYDLEAPADPRISLF